MMLPVWASVLGVLVGVVFRPFRLGSELGRTGRVLDIVIPALGGMMVGTLLEGIMLCLKGD